MPKDSTYPAANLQRALAQCKYEIIFYEYLIYANIVNIRNMLRYENLALFRYACIIYAQACVCVHTGMDVYAYINVRMCICTVYIYVWSCIYAHICACTTEKCMSETISILVHPVICQSLLNDVQMM